MFRSLVATLVLALFVASSRAEDLPLDQWEVRLRPWSLLQLRDNGEFRVERGVLISQKIEHLKEFSFEWAWEAQTSEKKDGDLVAVTLHSSGKLIDGAVADGIQVILDSKGTASISGVGASPTGTTKQIPVDTDRMFAISPRDFHTVKIVIDPVGISVILDGKVAVKALVLDDRSGDYVVLSNRRGDSNDQNSVSYASYFRNISVVK